MNENRDIFSDLSEEAYDMISVMAHSKLLEEQKNNSETKQGGYDMYCVIDELCKVSRTEGIEHIVQNCCMNMDIRNRSIPIVKLFKNKRRSFGR